MDIKITERVEKLMEVYGYTEDTELGRIPIYSDDMTLEELNLIERYIKLLIKEVIDTSS